MNKECMVNNVASGFVLKLYQMVKEAPDDIVTWLPSGEAFRISNLKKLEEETLPSFFRHGRFQSLVRQLNFYNFRKVNRERTFWIYRHPLFHRDRPHDLHLLRRRTCPGVDGRKVRGGSSLNLGESMIGMMMNSGSPSNTIDKNISLEEGCEAMACASKEEELEENKVDLKSKNSLDFNKENIVVQSSNSIELDEVESTLGSPDVKVNAEFSSSDKSKNEIFSLLDLKRKRCMINHDSSCNPPLENKDDKFVATPNIEVVFKKQKFEQEKLQRLVREVSEEETKIFFKNFKKRMPTNLAQKQQQRIVSQVAQKLQRKARKGPKNQHVYGDTMKYHALTYDDEIKPYLANHVKVDAAISPKLGLYSSVLISDESDVSSIDETTIPFSDYNINHLKNPILVRNIHYKILEELGCVPATVVYFCVTTSPLHKNLEQKLKKMLSSYSSVQKDFTRYCAALFPHTSPPPSQTDVYSECLEEHQFLTPVHSYTTKTSLVRDFAAFALYLMDLLLSNPKLLEQCSSSMKEIDPVLTFNEALIIELTAKNWFESTS